jgi:hypothetical protein
MRGLANKKRGKKRKRERESARGSETDALKAIQKHGASSKERRKKKRQIRM